MKQQSSEHPEQTRVIQFRDQGAGVTSVTVAENLAQVVARAAIVSDRKRDELPVSFSSLFIGMVATPDSTGKWLGDQFSPETLQKLLDRRGVDERTFLGLRESIPLDSYIAAPLLRTASARSAFTEGERLARDMSVVVDTRHVLAAYISLPAYHEADFRNLSIDRFAWAASFSREMVSRYPIEAAFWQSFAGRVFPPVDSKRDGAFDLESKNLERHVAEALGNAGVIAGDRPVEARDVFQAITTAGGRSKAFRRLAEIAGITASSAGGGSGAKTVRLHPILARQLAIAQRPKQGEPEARTVWGRDLVTAVLLCEDVALAKALNEIKRPIDVVRDRWFGFVTTEGKHRTREEWLDWWTLAGVRPPGERLSGIATETDQGEDKLGVEGEARAFARLIMDRKVQPPLSIGLLGDWGSGKSFFIEQIKKQIKILKGQGRPELFGDVVEIEFNAWHASDSNLWASLVTYIFDEIWTNIGGKQDPEAAREFILEALGDARGAISESEKQVDRASAALATAEKELKDRKEKLAWNAYVQSITKEKLKAIAKSAGWNESIETITDVDNAVTALETSSRKLQLVAETLLKRPVFHLSLATAALGAVALGYWVAAEKLHLFELSGLPQWIATAVAAVGAVAAPLKAASAKVDQLANGLSEIQTKYEARLQETTTPEAAKTVNEARRELESAESSVIAAKARLAELLNQQAALDPRRRLGTFLEERVQSTAYRSQQGIISLVHNDFQRLSEYMKDLRDHPEKADRTKPGIKSLERIVLYVDDLDRCRPVHVVHMLEAVHLLLALDLFVVVVAVDSRWLTRALELHYKEMLGGDSDDERLRASTPQNYLEKIFQVTYALGPMDQDHFKDYVAFLAGASPQTPAASEGAKNSGGKKVGDTSGDRSTGKGDDPTGTGGEGKGNLGKSNDEKSVDEKSESEEKQKATLPPTFAIRIDEVEQEILSSLVPLLPTPRVAKRLVNVYRLIKAGKTAEDLEEFLITRRAESNLLMLSILFGKPSIAAQLLRGLYERQAPYDEPKTLLRDAIRNRPLVPREPRHVTEEWTSLVQILDRLQVSATVEECAREPLEIARYSLVSGHDWHTWSKPKDLVAGKPQSKV